MFTRRAHETHQRYWNHLFEDHPTQSVRPELCYCLGHGALLPPFSHFSALSEGNTPQRLSGLCKRHACPRRSALRVSIWLDRLPPDHLWAGHLPLAHLARFSTASGLMDLVLSSYLHCRQKVLVKETRYTSKRPISMMHRSARPAARTVLISSLVVK